MKYALQTTKPFERWIKKLRNPQAVIEINARLRILADTGHFGDHKALGSGVGELRMTSLAIVFTTPNRAKY